MLLATIKYCERTGLMHIVKYFLQHVTFELSTCLGNHSSENGSIYVFILSQQTIPLKCGQNYLHRPCSF